MWVRLLLGLLILWALLSGRFRNILNNQNQMLTSLKKLAKKYNYPLSYAGFWLDVARMETDGFNSSLFLNNNNPWGMKVSKIRKNTQIFSDSQWAKYKNIGDGLEDIFLYMEARKYPKTIEQLSDFINLMFSKTYFVGESPFVYYQKVLAQKRRGNG